MTAEDRSPAELLDAPDLSDRERLERLRALEADPSAATAQGALTARDAIEIVQRRMREAQTAGRPTRSA